MSSAIAFTYEDILAKSERFQAAVNCPARISTCQEAGYCYPQMCHRRASIVGQPRVVAETAAEEISSEIEAKAPAPEISKDRIAA